MLKIARCLFGNRMDRVEPNGLNWTEVDQMHQCGPNGLKWTKNTEWTKLDLRDRSGMKWTKKSE